MGVMVVIPRMLMSGSFIIISLIKLALPIKHSDMIMEMDAQLKSNAKIVCPIKVAGHRKGLRFMEFHNLEK
mgnify:CR=1 FL=1